MRYILYFFWILIVFLEVIFAILNPQKIALNYYLGSITIELPLLVLLILSIGAVLGSIAFLPSWIKSKNTIRRLKHKVKQIEQEIKHLRTLPIKDIIRQ